MSIKQTKKYQNMVANTSQTREENLIQVTILNWQMLGRIYVSVENDFRQSITQL